MIYNMSELAFERDKRNAITEMRDYFVQKNRQEKAWNLVTAMMNSLKQNVFSNVEAQKITEFLSKKFDIRRPAIELAQTICFATIPIKPKKVNMNTVRPRRMAGESEISEQLFLRLQAAVQDDLIDYNGARSLVREIIVHYPKAQKYLQR